LHLDDLSGLGPRHSLLASLLRYVRNGHCAEGLTRVQILSLMAESEVKNNFERQNDEWRPSRAVPSRHKRRRQR